MRNQITHSAKALLAIMLSLLLLLLGACSSPEEPSEQGDQPTTASPAEKSPASEPPAGEPSDPAESPEPEPEVVDYNERITMMTQIYEGQDIVEIPYIEYDGENPELDSINTVFNQGFQMSYEEFLEEKQDGMWIEMKAYPFTSENYLQIVMTYCVYPCYGTEGYIESINYDRVSETFLTTEDALSMVDMTEDEVYDSVSSCEIPDSRGESLTDIAISGFIIKGTNEDEHIELLLILTLQNDDGNERDAFYSYNPEIDDEWDAVTKLSSHCPFDPADMDEMDPPLFYAQNAEPAQSLSGDTVFNSEWVNVETGETMVFDADLFIQNTDAWQTDLEGTYYSFDETEDSFNIIVYYNGGPSSSVYYNFNPDTQTLVAYAFGEIEGEWRIK